MSVLAARWFSLRSISDRQEVIFSRIGHHRSSCAFATLVCVIVALVSSSSLAQQPGAIPQFSTIEAHEYDTINMGTLGIQLNVPIRSKAGHIPFSYRLIGASQITLVTTVHGSWFSASPGLTGGEAHLAQRAGYTSTTLCFDQHGEPYGTVESGFYVTDALGNNHPFGFSLGSNPPSCDPQTTAGAYALDNSGLYLSVNWNNGSPTYTLLDVSGNSSAGSPYFAALADPNGNTISDSTDTLGDTAMTATGTSNTPQETFTWTDALNNNQTVKVTNSSYTMYTAFGCSADLAAAPKYFPTAISFPDNSTLGFSWEKSPLNNADYTGRVASIMLPNGGTISYAYSGGTNGINCLDGTPATMTRTTPDGQWVYTHVASSTSPTTTVQAPPTVNYPQGTYTVYTFVMGSVYGSTMGVPLETEKQVYNGNIAPGNLVETVITCYNNTSSTPTNCNPSSIGVAITEKDIYTTYPGVTGYSAVKTAYDSYGRIADVKTYDFNAATPTNEKQIQYGTGSPSSQTCTTISTYIIDKPCSVTLLDSQHNNAILSQTWNYYDSKGNLLQTWNLVSGSGASGTYLYKQYAYDNQGIVQTMTDVNLQVMNYTTTSCNNIFVTSQYPSNFSNLQTSQTWDCNGGVVTSNTDANGQTIQTKFYVGNTTDPFYRPLEDIDERGYITSFTYGYTSTWLSTVDAQFLFNSNASVIETLSTSDSIGRPAISQLRQGPSSANWDTKSRTFDSDGRVYETSLTCVNAVSIACSPSTESQTYDALNRPLVHTGTGGDIVAKTYYANDVLTTLTPAPANENAKAVQKEYDGLGRLKSTCLISNAAGSGPCGQTNGGTGFLTTYTYDAAGRLLQTVENAQVSSPQQTRKYTYDLLGRVLSETNPEWASTGGSLTAYYAYDSVSGSQACSTPTGMALGSNGDLIEKLDPNGNTTCYFYDKLHRNIAITYAGSNSNGVNKYFVYDAATVNGTAMAYTEGRLAETYTCSGATLPCPSMITDEGFSYDQRGQMSSYYQKSPNSGGYYAMSATHWEDKQLKTVSGAGLPTLTYGTLDGEGRVQTVGASSGTNPVSGVTYNNGSYTTEPIGALLTVTLGTGDAQNFTYDPNTSRMTSYSASVGATPVVISGTLHWNANGTLYTNNIVDQWNPADTQLCTYLYDDFVRVAGTTGSNPIAGVNCLNGSTKVWNQTFTYGSDAFGNLTKSSTGPGLSWACIACYNTATNQYNNVLSSNITYDYDGNLLNDTFHSYTWLADGHVATIDTNTITYDANGNKVEENVGGTIHEYVSAFGVTAQMTGSTENATNIDLPGGVQALYSGGTLQRFRFPDWQGTMRAESNPSTRLFTESLAFAPFGERYALKGAPYNVDSFTGKPDQIVTDEYDFPAREEHNGQGRWISPDPTRGTGNKYVYAANNPLRYVDPYGLWINDAFLPEGANMDLGGEGENELAESHPFVSAQTGGQVKASSSGNSSSSSTQTPAAHQEAQKDASAKAGEPAKQAQNTKSCGFWCRLGQRLENGFTGHGFKTNEQLTPVVTHKINLKPNFYSASVTVGVVSQSLTYVPSTNNLYYAPGPGVGTGAAVTAGQANDPNGFASGPSVSGCYFGGIGGCAGASTSGDTAVQVGVGVGGWGAAAGYGADPVQGLVEGMYNGTPPDPLATVPAGGLDWEDPQMPQIPQ